MDQRPVFCDVLIIGGGASGLAAAIAAAKTGARTCIVERDVACGLSILATGNGRCNLSNERLDPRRFHHPDAARGVFGADAEARIGSFCDDLGLMTCSIDGRIYPVTRRAESVRDCLLAACGRLGVAMRCGTRVLRAEQGREGGWELVLEGPVRPRGIAPREDDRASLRKARKALAAAELARTDLRARAVVIAVGGASSEICSLFGIPHLDEEPVLCPIAASLLDPSGRVLRGDSSPLASLDGIRLDGVLTLKRGDAAIAYEEGEILMRPYGVSGIAAFNLSRRCRPKDRIELDLFPTLSGPRLLQKLEHRAASIGAWSGDPAWFDGVLPRPLARLIASSVRNRVDPLPAAAQLMQHLSLEVEGTCEHQQAQVRRGGIPLGSVALETLAVRDRIGLYACGEALDQDADCGGYNLAWAWLTGSRAGDSAGRLAACAGAPERHDA